MVSSSSFHFSRMRRVKGGIKSLLGHILFWPPMHTKFFSNAAVVVAFHRVNDTTAGDGLTCSVALFERYCRFFARYFHVVSLRELLGRLDRGKPLNRELAITFDDGYRDNYEYAAPLLQKWGLPATFFVTTRFIGSDFVPMWDRSNAIRQPWMTWDQVKWLLHQGFDIGSHTQTHSDLGMLSGEVAWQEIHGSRLELQDRLSTSIDHFAYPFGAENHMKESNRQLVRAAGFRCCCSCFGGVNLAGSDAFSLRRMPISSWHISPHQFGTDLALEIHQTLGRQ